jgi:hypothetical protein
MSNILQPANEERLTLQAADPVGDPEVKVGSEVDFLLHRWSLRQS